MCLPHTTQKLTNFGNGNIIGNSYRHIDIDYSIDKKKYRSDTHYTTQNTHSQTQYHNC